MDNYIINIPNEKATSHKLVTFIIAIINLAAFVYLLLNTDARYLPIDGIVVSSLCILILATQDKWKWPSLMKVEWLFIVLGILWLLTNNFLPGFLMLIFALMGFYTHRKPVIRVTREGIYYPSIPVKLFTWDMVEFGILKDGILTIELKDNRVFQYTLNNEEASTIDESAFNEFCVHQKAGAS